LSPPTDLAPGFCDPIRITPREWNDRAFFVDRALTYEVKQLFQLQDGVRSLHN